ncbi:glycosyltransferase family 4 protein [Vibrio campbellii]|uniref:glycosyltransferase family 4 protein n=1 Tax=Vibrio campbellii TaxID=680 RepID=UPI0005EE219E|nr:glycosyltransferase family 4 protein [Vibrio campbellii]
MKVFIVGPFPEPIHGMSLANQNIYEYLNLKYYVSKHNTAIGQTIRSKSDQGKFQLLYFLKVCLDYLVMCGKLLFNSHDVVYITPGQSVLGFIRFLPVVVLAKLKGSSVIQHFHGSRFVNNVNDSRLLARVMIGKSIGLTDQFIVLSDSLKTTFSEVIPTDKLKVCYNGVPVPRIINENKKERLSVLYMSNLMVDKGIKDLFEAIHSSKKYCDPSFEFHFAGEIESGIRKECMDFFSSHEDCCTYHGIVSGAEKHCLLEEADILILPSYDEGVPLAILEAYSYRCAVITTKVGGIPDIFDDGINGRFVPVGDPKAISDRLVDLIPQLELIKQTNQKLALDKYSLMAFCNNIDNLIKESQRNVSK